MKEDKIEVMAQPTTKEVDSEVRDTTINKLQHLIDIDLEHERACEYRKPTDSSEKTSEEEPRVECAQYDEDGFRVPVGKIPLDGQFSALEIKELVSLGKEEGILKSDIRVRVSESNSISKHMEIVEPRQETA